MDPYHILGLSPNATPDDIKRAYRRLVKQFHPDKNPTDEAREQVRLINAAYEILSDPVKRTQYHQPAYASVAYEEDPIEVYKREFKRRRWEREQEEKAQEEVRRNAYERKTFKLMRTLAFPILAFSLILVVDDLLPRNVYEEVPVRGWQEGTGSRRSPLMSYIETWNFYLPIPHEFHLRYPYYANDKPSITVSVTPIFDVPRDIRCNLFNERWYFEIAGTIHSNTFKLPWLLLLCSLYVVASRFSKLSYSLCGVPALLLAFVVLIMWV